MVGASDITESGLYGAPAGRSSGAADLDARIELHHVAGAEDPGLLRWQGDPVRLRHRAGRPDAGAVGAHVGGHDVGAAQLEPEVAAADPPAGLVVEPLAEHDPAGALRRPADRHRLLCGEHEAASDQATDAYREDLAARPGPGVAEPGAVPGAGRHAAPERRRRLTGRRAVHPGQVGEGTAAATTAEQVAARLRAAPFPGEQLRRGRRTVARTPACGRHRRGR